MAHAVAACLAHPCRQLAGHGLVRGAQVGAGQFAGNVGVPAQDVGARQDLLGGVKSAFGRHVEEGEGQGNKSIKQ